jgi:glycosyltransferase involved in cell wall biosynthesis
LSKISVIIPAFNVAAFIGQTLESVLANQVEMDIIVVDDASSDNTCEIVEHYAKLHANIRLMRSETNTGPGVARNRALATVESEYCLFHDADDILKEGTIDTVLAMMDETAIDVAVFQYSLLTSEDSAPTDMGAETLRIWNDVVGDQDTAIVDIDVGPAAQFLIMVNYPWNKIFRTSFIRRVGVRFSSARINEDILPHWAAYMHAGRFLAISRNLTVHRLIPGREQHTNIYDERRLEIFAALRDTEKLFEENSDFRQKYFHLFLFFKWGLLHWAFTRLQPQLRGLFNEHVKISYKDFTDEDFARVYKFMPELALRSYRMKYAPDAVLK